MRSLSAQDALCAHVHRVAPTASLAEIRGEARLASFFAIIAPELGAGDRCLGYVSREVAAANPTISMDSLVAGEASLASLPSEMELSEVLRHMDRSEVDAWPIVNRAGSYVGTVTRRSAAFAQRALDAGRALQDALAACVADPESTAAIQALIQAASTTSGRYLVRSLITGLAGFLDVDLLLVGMLVAPGATQLDVVVASGRGSPIDPKRFRWARYSGDPLDQGDLCVVASGARERFPEDPLLARESIDAFVVLPLSDSHGRPLGVMAALNRAPFEDERLVSLLLRAFALRATTELEALRSAHGMSHNEQRYRTLLDQASDGILLSDEDGHYVDANPRACEMLGYSRAELVGLAVQDLITPEDLERRPLAHHLIKHGERFSAERQLRRADGSAVTADISARRLGDGGVLAIVRDVSERRSDEDRLRESHSLLDTIRAIQSEYIAHRDRRSLFGQLLRSLLSSTQSSFGFIGELIVGAEGSQALRAYTLNPARRGDAQAPLASTTVPVGALESSLADALRLGVPQVQNTAPDDIRLNGLADFFPRVTASLALPFVVGEDVVGVALLANREGGYELELPRRLEPLTTTCANIISAYRLAEKRRHAESVAARLGRILDQSGSEILVLDTDNRRVVQANEGALQELGYTMEQLKTKTLVDLLPHVSAEHLHDILERLRRGETDQVTFETVQRSRDGTLQPVEVRAFFSRAEAPGLFVAIVRDISARKRAEEQLSYVVHYDSLTGLPNRLLLVDRLQQGIVEAAWDGTNVAVMTLDLDRFKTINDTLGHESGDALLKAFAERLSAQIRPGDTMARLGGDEFAFVLTQIGSVEDAARAARRMLQFVERPFGLSGRELFVTASIGIALYPADGDNVGALLRNSDTALHHAKRMGRNTYQFFTAQMNAQVVQRLRLEMALRRALERDELEVRYQPKLGVTSGRVIGAEALLRWHHPTLGTVAPTIFIPLAEETGLINPIGHWVLGTAARQCKGWQEEGFGDLSISVNLSPRQLEQNLVHMVARTLQDNELSAASLNLELTESVLMTERAEAIAELWKLKDAGVGLALDDFGTGYSSLTYLRRFPFDTLKIDRTFVRDLTDHKEHAIAGAIVAMAHRLGLSVVAEGVETQAQLDYLREQGCDAFQGFLFSRAVSAADFGELLRSGAGIDLAAGTGGNGDGSGS